jgi:hypothetical protein
MTPNGASLLSPKPPVRCLYGRDAAVCHRVFSHCFSILQETLLLLRDVNSNLILCLTLDILRSRPSSVIDYAL